MSDHSITIAVFAKPPVPGEVKTRLIPVLGDSGAAQLAMAFLVDTLTLVQRLSWARPVIATTGPFPTLDHGLSAIPFWEQGSGDLGARLERIIVRGLDDGDRSVIALGADSPGLSVRALDEAKRVLVTRQAVLGPSHDGGYYLIGLRRCPGDLLKDIPWSVPETFEKTRARILSTGLSLGIGEPYFDIDTPADLARLEDQLRRGAVRAPATAETLIALGRT